MRCVIEILTLSTLTLYAQKLSLRNNLLSAARQSPILTVALPWTLRARARARIRAKTKARIKKRKILIKIQILMTENAENIRWIITNDEIVKII